MASRKISNESAFWLAVYFMGQYVVCMFESDEYTDLDLYGYTRRYLEDCLYLDKDQTREMVDLALGYWYTVLIVMNIAGTKEKRPGFKEEYKELNKEVYNQLLKNPKLYWSDFELYKIRSKTNA